MKKLLVALGLALLSASGHAQFGVVAPLHVNGNQLNDQYGNKVVLHGVMDTPNPYFNKNRWGWGFTDSHVAACINYFDKVFAALQNPAKGTYCNIFRLHLDPCWTNDPDKTSTGTETGEANISRFSATRLQRYMDILYWPIAQKALNHGLYVVIRPPGVCPKSLKVGDEYQQYLKTVWNIVSSNSNIKNNSGIVSLELANEPVNVYNQYGQTSATALRDYFQPIVDIIRANGFTGIIWVPGAGYQSQYQSYATYPITDSNYGYAVHVYPGWYGASDTSYDHQTFITNFKNQVPVVTSKPILVSEIDWSPEKEGTGKYNEFGQWVASNWGTWGTASTSKWGNAWKAVKDYYGNISMTLTSTDDYLDVDAYLNDGTIRANFDQNVEACAMACFYWYYEYSKKDYAQASSSQSTSATPSGTNLITAWADANDFVPAGWTVSDNGTSVYPGNTSSGPRVMQLTGGGDMTSAFYVREVSPDKAGYIEYGGTSGYTLPLVYGEYELSCNVAAWKGSPYLKCEVFDPEGSVLASTIVKANCNVNGSRSATISGSTHVRLSFYSMIKGNYRVRFSPVADEKGNGGYWQEVLVGNVGLYYKGNALAFTTANEVPSGWTIVDKNSAVAAGTAATGPRIFQFTGGGDFSTGLYIRQAEANKAGYAEFGSADGYGLSLKAGQYKLTYNAVAWSGSPYLKCEVFDQSGQSLGSQIIQCAKSVGKSLSVSTGGSASGVVNFYAPQTGYYRFRWTPCADQWGNAGTWLEVVFGHIKIQKATASAVKAITESTATAIESVELTETGSADEPIYNLNGQRVQSPHKGIYIKGGKKILVK
jgi:hypothetical protein